MNDVHVVPNGHGWTIEVGGEKRRDGFDTQVEAMLVGCRLAEERGGEVVVHGTPATGSLAPAGSTR